MQNTVKLYLKAITIINKQVCFFSDPNIQFLILSIELTSLNIKRMTLREIY